MTDYKVVVFDATNLSDHLPIQFCLAMQSTTTRYSHSVPKHIVKEFRWDRGNLHGYYAYIGDLLSKLDHTFSCLNSDDTCSAFD